MPPPISLHASAIVGPPRSRLHSPPAISHCRFSIQSGPKIAAPSVFISAFVALQNASFSAKHTTCLHEYLLSVITTALIQLFFFAMVNSTYVLVHCDLPILPVGQAQHDRGDVLATDLPFWHVPDENLDEFRPYFHILLSIFSMYVPTFHVG